MDKILKVRNLTKLYGRGCEKCVELTGFEAGTNICSNCGSVVSAHDVSFDLYKGEILALIGESGSGKSTLVKCLYFDEMPSEGSATFYDEGQSHDLFNLNAAQQRRLANHRLGMVYQNPYLGLNFNISAGGNVAERLLVSGKNNYSRIRECAYALLHRAEVPAERIDALPKTFSGGMQQRVQIAKALSTCPPLLYLDEITTGLDLSVQAAILDLIMEIQQEMKTAMIVVTHDLGVIRLLAGRTLVMKYGRVIESGLTDQILEDPQHAYTQRLVASSL